MKTPNVHLYIKLLSSLCLLHEDVDQLLVNRHLAPAKTNGLALLRAATRGSGLARNPN